MTCLLEKLSSGDSVDRLKLLMAVVGDLKRQIQNDESRPLQAPFHASICCFPRIPPQNETANTSLFLPWINSQQLRLCVSEAGGFEKNVKDIQGRAPKRSDQRRVPARVLLHCRIMPPLRIWHHWGMLETGRPKQSPFSSLQYTQ